jgi:hypothetical protein
VAKKPPLSSTRVFRINRTVAIDGLAVHVFHAPMAVEYAWDVGMIDMHESFVCTSGLIDTSGWSVVEFLLLQTMFELIFRVTSKQPNSTKRFFANIRDIEGLPRRLSKHALRPVYCGSFSLVEATEAELSNIEQTTKLYKELLRQYRSY